MARLNVWVLDGDQKYRDLLRFPLNASTVKYSVAIVCLDLSEPWRAMESLKTWVGVLKAHIEGVHNEMSDGDVESMKQSILDEFQLYQEPSAEKEGKVQLLRQGSKSRLSVNYSNVDPKSQLPLGEGVLTSNLGIPLIVVGTKSDQLTMLEKEYHYGEAHFDFIQRHLRLFSLEYGASLVYTSSKDSKNCALLSEYLMHRCYGIDFGHKAQVLDKDAVFVPSGWDSIQKIKVLMDATSLGHDPSEPYDRIIVRPTGRRRQEFTPDSHVAAENEQDFLYKLKQDIEKGGSSASQSFAGVLPTEDYRQRRKALSMFPGQEEQKTAGDVSQKPRGSLAPGAMPMRSASARKPSAVPNVPVATAAAAGGEPGGDKPPEDALVNFFHSLLNRDKTTSFSRKSAGSPGDPKRDYRKNAEIQLDRMRAQSVMKTGTSKDASSSSK
eukprot:GFYU01010400.1.p1 GENE.GFYU01010400.1~~GFYU01010400.1.p1  ORF type:complete len:449 (-),score=122.63 GFYU01010400.1:74-1387(-)